MVRSAYDYVVKSTMGFHVDFDSTLGKQLEEARSAGAGLKPIRASQLDSATEKCEVAIRDMHRPIVFSETASEGHLLAGSGPERELMSAPLTPASYYRIVEGVPATRRRSFDGRVSSYNINTFRGRIFLNDAGRPVPFEIATEGRTPETIRVITRSLALNARNRRDDRGEIVIVGRPSITRTGRIASVLVDMASEPEPL